MHVPASCTNRHMLLLIAVSFLSSYPSDHIEMLPPLAASHLIGWQGQLQSIAAMVQDTRRQQIMRWRAFAPGSVALLLLFCLLALLLQLPFLPAAQVQVYQHIVTAKLLQLFNGHL